MTEERTHPQPDTAEVLFIPDVAPMVRLPVPTVRTMARAGKMGFRKVGKRYMTTRAAVRVWLDSFADGVTA